MFKHPSYFKKNENIKKITRKVLFMFYHLITIKIVIIKKLNKMDDQTLNTEAQTALRIGRREC